MMQLFLDAWMEWQRYTSDGKLAALLLAALLYLWFTGKYREQRGFVLYTTVITVCCILPVTAALLWMYQTKFYDYKWIWSMVPQTAVTAYGAVLLLADSWWETKNAGWRRGLPVTALLLAVVLLCGGLGKEVWNQDEQAAESQQAQEILAGLRERCSEGDICLWAPREILEYVREIDAAVRIPYGRNMWDLSLNAYSYDMYDDDMIHMYQWMEFAVESGAGEKPPEGFSDELPELEECVDCALEAGVNCILLPQDVNTDILRQMEELLDARAEHFGAYYLLIL